jgi:hypothetical protein
MTDELARIFRVTLVTSQIPPPPDEDEERLRSACACLVCRYPEWYVDAHAVAHRAMHIVEAHRDFDEFLADPRNASHSKRWASNRHPRDPNDPSDQRPFRAARRERCRVHPGVPAHPVHE